MQVLKLVLLTLPRGNLGLGTYETFLCYYYCCNKLFFFADPTILFSANIHRMVAGEQGMCSYSSQFMTYINISLLPSYEIPAAIEDALVATPAICKMDCAFSILPQNG